MRASSNEGLALPNPFRKFAEHGAYLRRGQVSVWAGASGAGKSAVASHIAIHARPKIPTLYCSADTDKVTLGIRAAASLTNSHIDDVEVELRQDDAATWDTVRRGTDHIWFYWDAQPTLEDIDQEVHAYAYVTGAWPHLVVVDNLINVDADGAASHIQKDAVMHHLQTLANYTNAHVMVLHHVTGSVRAKVEGTYTDIFYEDGNIPVPKSALLDKVAKRPRLVVTLYRAAPDLLGVCVVKNSSGPAQADASYGFNVAWFPEKCYMRG